MRARFIWRAFKTRYRDGVAELSAIKRVIRLDDTVCDIGANKGAYTYWFSRWAPCGRVIAFEPQPQLASYLAAACAALRLKNVTVEAKAVAAKSGILTLYVPGSSDSPGASLSKRVSERETCRCVSVQCVSLDEYFTPETRISVIKIDVEGAEKAVFQGAERILTEQSPLLVFECENRHLESGTVFDVLHYLNALGYSGEFVFKRRLRPVAEFNPAIHQKQDGPRFWDAKDYCNNFVFRKISTRGAPSKSTRL